MLENIVSGARDIDYRILDELNSAEGETAQDFKGYLTAIETLA